VRYVLGSGQLSHPYPGSLPGEPLGWFGPPALHLGLLGASLLVMLATMLGWLVGAWLRRLRGGELPAPPAQARLARLAAGAAIAALVPALAGIAALGLLDDLSWVAGSAVVAAPKALFSVGAATTLATVGYAGVAWRNRWWSLPHRVHFSAVAFALTTFVAVANQYHLVGWPLVGCA
jgi:hypothetical protein